MDNYYLRTEVSNSDLSWLDSQLYPREMPDPTEAYRFGSLIDCMITEPEKVDYYQFLLEGEKFKEKDFENAIKMRDAFFSDAYCQKLADLCVGQQEMTKHASMDFGGIPFHLNTRCKWDLWSASLGWGGDIKSTAATSQAQFEAAAKHFNYDRQRAWYMDIAGSDQDVLIAISKKNHKIFKIHITRDDPFYKDGYNKYINLAYRWWMMYGENKLINTYKVA